MRISDWSSDVCSSDLAAGVWKRSSFGAWGNAVKPVLLFVRAPAYHIRFRFEAVVNETLAREWPGALAAGVRTALASSKRQTRRCFQRALPGRFQSIVRAWGGERVCSYVYIEGGA